MYEKFDLVDLLLCWRESRVIRYMRKNEETERDSETRKSRGTGLCVSACVPPVPIPPESDLI